MFRMIIISIVLTIGLAGCGEDVPQKSINEGNTPSQIESKPVTSKMNTQDVKKADVQAVAIQSQTMEASQAVAQALVKEKEVAPVQQQVQQIMKPAKEKVVVEVVKEKTMTKAVTTKKVEAAVKVKAIKNKVDATITTPAKQELALGDAVKGKKLAKRCVSCHDFGTKDKVGPHLKGIFNRAAGQSGFKKHGAALKTANWTWDEAHLLTWLCNSKAAIKEFTGDASARTKMPNQKMCGAKGNDIVAYLKLI
ncbi:MAG: c-type cytochrome [Mariprofundaceae bacterium]|nr:c-type cytochrome [Mariprofundaceae bacterium]